MPAARPGPAGPWGGPGAAAPEGVRYGKGVANMNQMHNGERRGLRGAGRAAAVSFGSALTLFLASPAAQALTRDDGDDPGEGLSVFETLSLFVVAPVLLFVLIAGLVVLSDRKS